MNRDAAILVAMAPAKRASFTPVQMQKLMFLLDRELADGIGGPLFDFRPYDYGPFDAGVYESLDELIISGRVELVLVPGQQWFKFRTTETGQPYGEQELDRLPQWVKNGITIYSGWVQSLSFPQLVSAIYKKYPDMKINSVFNS